MRHLFAVFLMVSALCSVVVADTTSKRSTGSLTIEGDTITVVTKLPFKVRAPAGYKLYFWTLPGSWKHDARTVSTNSVVTVSEAPEGSAVVTVVAVPSDFNPAEFTLKVNVGRVVPPAPPVPPVPPGPAPDASLLKALQPLYATDTSPEKAKHKAALAALWRQAGKFALEQDNTTAQWLARVREASKAMLPVDALVNLRQAVGSHLNARLPRNPDAALDAATRALLVRESALVAATLEALR